jgi:hypothetical protein
MDYQRLYEYRFRNIDQSTRSGVWGEIARYVTERALARPRRLLDPAAGRREFIDRAHAEEKWAVDRVDYGEAVAGSGTRLIISDVMDAELPADYFDGIFVSNFLEHLPTPDAVYDFLVRMRTLSAPGGRIAIMGPNFRYCASDYFDCADHTLALSDVSVAEHLHTAGYRVASVTPRFLPFSFRGRLPTAPGLVRAYLAFPAAWRAIGKQFLVVGER